jgi:hypothetical protein
MEKKSKFKPQGKARVQSKGAGYDRRNEKDKAKSTNCKDNDPSWYLVNGQLAKDVANFSFNNALGDNISITPGRVFDIGTTLVANSVRLPGIASVMVGPSVGPSLNETSPINVASRNIYSFVRHANSGHANYDPADLMIYLLAVDSVQSYWSWMVRIYGISQTFSQRNRYIGDALLKAMGVDPANIRANICELRAFINQYAIKASVLAVPNTMSYYLRHAWMFQNVYTDEDNPKAQLFLFNPAYLYSYSLNAGGVGELKPTPIAMTNSNNAFGSTASLTFTNIRDMGNSFINAMLAQEDVGIMSGDILKAYGSDKLYRFNQIAEEYAVIPTFSEEVLGQFHNLSVVGRYPCKSTTDGWVVNLSDALTISQDTGIGSGNLIFNPAFAACMDTSYTQIIDAWKNDVTPEDALVYSRLKSWTNPTGGKIIYNNVNYETTYAGTLSSSGSELVIDVILYYYNPAGALANRAVKPVITSSAPDTVDTAILQYADKFNEFPILRAFNKLGSMTAMYGEISNYTVINETELSAMHNAALLSMFGVPYNW